MRKLAIMGPTWELTYSSIGLEKAKKNSRQRARCDFLVLKSLRGKVLPAAIRDMACISNCLRVPAVCANLDHKITDMVV